MVRALLEAGAIPDPGTTTGAVTPLHLAAASGNAPSVAVLIEHGADVDRRETAWGQTALMFAAAEGRVQAVRALLKGGAGPDLTSPRARYADQGVERQRRHGCAGPNEVLSASGAHAATDRDRVP